MKKLIYIIAAFTTLANYSCEVELFGCLSPEGEIIRQEVSLSEISKIDLAISGEIIIKKGESQIIEIESAQNVIDRILSDSDFDGDKWDIEIKGCSNVEDVKIYATLVDLESLDISGAGSIVTEGVFSPIDKINLEIDGSGVMDIQLATVDKVDIEISGSGLIAVSGVCHDESIEIDGNGTINAFDLISTNCRAEIDGNSNIQVYVEEFLNIDFDGSGTLCYRGNPTLNLDINGNGQVNDCN